MSAQRKVLIKSLANEHTCQICLSTVDCLCPNVTARTPTFSSDNTIIMVVQMSVFFAMFSLQLDERRQQLNQTEEKSYGGINFLTLMTEMRVDGLTVVSQVLFFAVFLFGICAFRLFFVCAYRSGTCTSANFSISQCIPSVSHRTHGFIMG